MCKLSKSFKELSTIDRVKLVVTLPIICVVILIAEMIDLLVYVLRCVLHFVFRNWKELLIVSATVLLVVTLIMVL